MAYTYTINKNTSDSHQTSPAYMLTFLRWSNRDTSNFSDADYLELRKPLIVVNDCVSLTVSSSKASHIHQAEMIMLGGDINYATAVAPGDFVLVNMLDSDEHLFGSGKGPIDASADSLYVRASSSKPINNIHDGFKGVFKIQSVRKILQVDPSSGVKILRYQISAAAFTEFNQVIYFNAFLADQSQDQLLSELINAEAHKEWASNTKKSFTLDELFSNLVGFMIGTGFQEFNDKIQKKEVVKNFNKNFLMPPKLSSLMGLGASGKDPITAARFFKFYVGIQEYGSSYNQKFNGLDPLSINPVRYDKLSGTSPISPEPFCQVTAWSVLNQYSNSLINEMFTSFKLTEDGKVMPCVVFRQKPFTSKKFIKENPTTKVTPFLSLPRWKVSLDLIKAISTGRSEAARINFVHIVGKARYTQLNSYTAQQASLNSFKADEQDIKRNGLKPLIAACDFDFPTDENKTSNSPVWNQLMFDWLSNGHLKENGTIVCAGIEDPIAVGDNLELEDTVYHIESVTHSMNMQNNGFKNFETNLKLSYGVDKRDKGYDPIYPEMQYTDSESYRKDNWNRGYESMPGFSDTQDIAGRVKGEEIGKTPEKAFSLVPKTIKAKSDKE